MSAEDDLAGFIAKYTPEIAQHMRLAVEKMRDRLPGAVELVWDNYNGLVVGFGPTDRTSDVIFSIAAYPRWVSLFFFDAADLPDPLGLLRGSGKNARHIVLDPPDRLDDDGVRALMDESLRRAGTPIDAKARPRLVIKSVSAKQRPRLPPGAPR